MPFSWNDGCLSIRDLERKKKLFTLSFTSHSLLLHLSLFSFLLLHGRVPALLLHVSLLYLPLFALIRTIVCRKYGKLLLLLTELVAVLWLDEWLKLVL